MVHRFGKLPTFHIRTCLKLIQNSGCRFSSQNTCTFTLILQRAKVSKYHQIFKIRFSTQNINIGCIDAEFCADFAIFLHFSRSTRIYWRKCVKMLKKCKNPSHQISEIFRKSAKNGHVLIFWLYIIILYFGTLLDVCIFILKFAKICSQRAQCPLLPSREAQRCSPTVSFRGN